MENQRVENIWFCGLAYVQILQLLLHFVSAEVESIKGITFILAKLWDIIQLLIK